MKCNYVTILFRLKKFTHCLYRWTSLYAIDRDRKNWLTYNELKSWIRKNKAIIYAFVIYDRPLFELNKKIM